MAVTNGGGRAGISALRDREQCIPLSGGLALHSGGDLLEEPQCCGDLGNIEDWREAAAYRGGEWQMLWIGHPSMSVRFGDGLLYLSDPHEEQQPVARYHVSPDELAKAIAEAVVELEAFALRLRPVLVAEVGADAAGWISRLLAGLSR